MMIKWLAVYDQPTRNPEILQEWLEELSWQERRKLAIEDRDLAPCGLFWLLGYYTGPFYVATKP